MPHILINLRAFPFSKVCAFHRYGVRLAPFWCAPCAVLLCGLLRFMHFQLWSLVRKIFWVLVILGLLL
jgi:hypothetical protein